MQNPHRWMHDSRVCMAVTIMHALNLTMHVRSVEVLANPALKQGWYCSLKISAWSRNRGRHLAMSLSKLKAHTFMVCKLNYSLESHCMPVYTVTDQQSTEWQSTESCSVCVCLSWVHIFLLSCMQATKIRLLWSCISISGNHLYNKGGHTVLTVRQPWYHKRLSRENAESKLEEGGTDSFLVRESAQEAGKLVLSIKSGDKFYHFPIERGVGSYQVEGTDEPFPSLVELIDHYVQHGLPESDSGELVIFKSPCVCDASLVSSNSSK